MRNAKVMRNLVLLGVFVLCGLLSTVSYADQKRPPAPGDHLQIPQPPSASCIKPGKPTLLEPFNGATVQTTGVSFDWYDVPVATSYCVYIVEIPPGQFNIPLGCGEQKCNRTDGRWVNNPPFVPGKYGWCVQAINSCGKGPLSSTWKFTSQ